jgi:hypothetical protein
MPRRLAILLASLLFSFPLGCDDDTFEPALRIGVSKCDRCGSTIRDRSWAAAERVGTEERLYDDPGCLLDVHRGGTGGETVLFQDRNGTGRWLSSDEVWLARSEVFPSPRGSHWAAYATFADAQDAVTAAGHGDILRFPEALRFSPEQP